MDGAVMTTFLPGPPTKPNLDARLAASRGGPRLGRAGRRVLIVEDEALIAGLIESILSEAGWSTVGPIATLTQAFETIERERFDAALLDVRINGHDTYGVAEVLKTRGIPFIFVSGFTRKQMAPGYRHCPYIGKPFTPAAILALLNKVVAPTRL